MNDILQCRLCAEFKRLNELMHINQKESLEMNLEHKIQECLNLNFTDSLLPKYICSTCCDKVSSSFEFQELVKQAQILLQNSLAVNVKDEFDVKDQFDVKDEFDFDDIPGESVQNFSDRDDLIIKEESSDNNIDDVPLSKLKSTSKRTIRKRKINFDGRKNRKLIKEDDSNVDPGKIVDKNGRSEIIRRVRNDWKNYKWKCAMCNEELSSAEVLQNHFLEIHQKPAQYLCTECSKTFDNYYRFKKHLNKHKQEFNYRCPDCSKLFSLKKNYENHLRNKHGSKDDLKSNQPLTCTECNKNLKSVVTLRNHYRNCHSSRPKFKCELCNKQLNTKNNLEDHIKWHKGERNFTCELCGKNFSRVSNLSYHTKSAHSEEKPYCCPHCQRTFKIKQLLKRHLQVHSDDKRHACEICGKRFHRTGTLREHLKVHSNILEFECSHCKKQFKNVYRLKIHIRQHTGERPYTCVQCNHYFTDSSNYVKHMKSKHGVLTTRKDVTYKNDPPVAPKTTPDPPTVNNDVKELLQFYIKNN